MSNFTDFFPTGLPVNSYAPFFISGTGNPAGYNATTGLYTHPNGDVWLKTGNTITSSGTNPYPSSTYSSSFINSFNRYNSVSAVGSSDSRIGVGKTKLAGLQGGYNTTLYYYNSTDLTNLGPIQSKVPGGNAGFEGYPSIGFNRNTDEFYFTTRDPSGPNNRIVVFDEATLTETNFLGPYTEITQYIYGIAIDSTNGVYYLLDGSNTSAHIYQYDLSTNAYTGLNLFAGNTGSSGLAIQGFTFDGTYLIIANRQPSNNQTLEFYGTNNGTALSYVGSMATPGVDYRDLKFDHNTNNKFYVSIYANTWQNANTPIYTQNYISGDTTARTDTDSGQPLFVKIK